MGLKDWFKGGAGDSARALRIQDIESILVKRLSKEDGSITLIVESQEYRLVRAKDYDRIMAVVEQIEALARRLKQ